MNSKRRIHLVTAAAVIVIAAIFLTSFGREKSTAAASPPSLPEVQVAVVEQRDLPVRHEWIGTLNGLVNAAINAEVTGYLLRQDYSEGSFVHKGQLLFEIDPRPFQAAADQAAGQLAQSKAQLTQAQAGLAQAQAQLLSTEANQRRSQLDEEKYKPLFGDKAVTRQDLDKCSADKSSQLGAGSRGKGPGGDLQGAN
jgi:multidrug efflux pump subunit AcrA (membrane-fusion protein)